LLPWAREIARRRIQEHYRRSRREAAIDPVLATRLAEAADRVEQARPSSVQRAALLACLEQLPDENRQLISMRYDGSFASMGELAQAIGRTVQSTYALIKRIKTLLRQCTERRLKAENAS
jgi:RNA polymerase sigma factor (sigma-70 family)